MPALEVLALDTATPQIKAPQTGDTYSAPRAVSIAPESLTGTAATTSLDIAQTWNTTGTPTAVKLNVTDTASNAASLLMDLQTGGTSRFSVSKNGNVALGANGSSGSPSIGRGTSGFYFSGANGLIFPTQGGVYSGLIGSTVWTLPRDSAFAWESAGAASAEDLVLRRDAADTLAQRRGTNAQNLRVYNTFTDASNYERVSIGWNANTLTIAAENAGTGSNRGITLQGKAETIVESTLSQVTLKTSGSARWFVSASGVFGAAVDNTLDIGASGANRPRSIYSAQGVVFANSFAVNSSTSHALLWNAGQFGWTSSATASTTAAIDTGLSRAAAAIVGVTNGSTGGGSIEMQEVTAPAAPAANRVRIYAEDNGSGKTRLMALFNTGAAVQIAIEP